MDQTNGAGDGNRTLATGLEGQGSTTELHPLKLERKTRFELATLALARRCSTTEPLPHGGGDWIRTSESVANGFTVRPLWPTREPLHEIQNLKCKI